MSVSVAPVNHGAQETRALDGEQRPPRRLDHIGLYAMTLAFRIAPLTSTQRLVLAAIASHADSSGRGWPGENRIAAESGLRYRAVRNGVRDLRHLGILSVVRRGRQLTNAYTLHVTVLESLPMIAGDVEVTGTTCPSAALKRPAPDDPVTGITRPSDRHHVPLKGSERTAQEGESGSRSLVVNVFEQERDRTAGKPMPRLGAEELAAARVFERERLADLGGDLGELRAEAQTAARAFFDDPKWRARGRTGFSTFLTDYADLILRASAPRESLGPSLVNL